MKDILVEFTDYGAIIHKNPSVISSKRDLPYCFFNPDISKVSGVSPSYWVYNKDNEIVPASPEERQRRNEYHKSKSSENTVSLKQTMDSMRQEIADDIDASLTDLYLLINETHSKVDNKVNDLSSSLDFTVKCFRDNKDLNKEKFKELEKQLNRYKIALIVLSIIALIGAIK